MCFASAAHTLHESLNQHTAHKTSNLIARSIACESAKSLAFVDGLTLKSLNCDVLNGEPSWFNTIQSKVPAGGRLIESEFHVS